MWRSQPGAYECIGPDVTVNGKSLDYFCEVVERTRAQSERMAFGQREVVNAQISNLLQYCNHY